MKNKFIQSFMVAAIAGLISTNVYSQEKESKEGNKISIQSIRMEDSETPTTMNITCRDGGKLYKMKVEDLKIVEMTIDDKKVPPEEFPNYEKLLKKILAKIEEDRAKAKEDRRHAVIEREKAEDDREEVEGDRRQADREKDRFNEDRERVNSERADASRERERAYSDARRAERNAESVVGDRKRSEDEYERTQEHRAKAERDRRNSDEYREHAEQERTRVSKDRDHARVDRKRAEEDRQLLHDLLDDVVEQKIVNDEDDIKTLVLDEKKLIINGETQKEELHKKFKENYLKKTGSRIHYRNDRNFKGISIDNYD